MRQLLSPDDSNDPGTFPERTNIKTGAISTNQGFAIGPVLFLSFQPRVLLLNDTLIQLPEERRWNGQRLPNS